MGIRLHKLKPTSRWSGVLWCLADYPEVLLFYHRPGMQDSYHFSDQSGWIVDLDEGEATPWEISPDSVSYRLASSLSGQVFRTRREALNMIATLLELWADQSS